MDKYQAGLKEIETKNKAFLESLIEISQAIRALLESCMTLDNDLGRYQFESFAKELLQVLEWNENWKNLEIDFEEILEIIRKIYLRVRCGRDLEKIRPKIIQSLNALRFNFLQKFIPKVGELQDDDIWKISGCFCDLENAELRAKIVKNNIENALKIIEVSKKFNPRAARCWIDHLENEESREKLHDELDQLCVESAFRAKQDDSSEMYFYCKAIQNKNLREKTSKQLPPEYISEKEFLKR